MWVYVVLNVISLICWTYLAIAFNKWWIALFALFFIVTPSGREIKQYYRYCDMCGKKSPHANSPEEAIAKAKFAGWFRIEKGDKVLDYCPICKTMHDFK